MPRGDKKRQATCDRCEKERWQFSIRLALIVLESSRLHCTVLNLSHISFRATAYKDNYGANEEDLSTVITYLLTVVNFISGSYKQPTNDLCSYVFVS